jgi:hypothetical protein
LVLEFGGELDELVTLRTRHHAHSQSGRVDAGHAENMPGKAYLGLGMKVTARVVALAALARTDKNTIAAGKEGFHYHYGIHPTRAHNSYHPDVRGILKPRYPGEVSSAVCSPVAAKGYYVGLETHRLSSANATLI